MASSIRQSQLYPFHHMWMTRGAPTPGDMIHEVVDSLTAKGFAPPEDGIRPVDPDYVPAY